MLLERLLAIGWGGYGRQFMVVGRDIGAASCSYLYFTVLTHFLFVESQ